MKTLEAKHAMIHGLQELSHHCDLLEIGDLVFVYGTLKRNYPNHSRLLGARFIGDAATSLPWALPIYGGFHIPTLLPINEGERVLGEVYRPGPKGWRSLDYLEGHPRNYQRMKIEVNMISDGSKKTAWCYFFKHPMPGDLVPSRWASEWTPRGV